VTNASSQVDVLHDMVLSAALPLGLIVNAALNPHTIPSPLNISCSSPGESLRQTLLVINQAKPKTPNTPHQISPPTRVSCSSRQVGCRALDGLDLEVQGDETEHERLKILDKIIKHPQALGVGGIRDIVDRANLSSLVACQQQRRTWL
jgi:hypothetical protein